MLWFKLLVGMETWLGIMHSREGADFGPLLILQKHVAYEGNADELFGQESD